VCPAPSKQVGVFQDIVGIAFVTVSEIESRPDSSAGFVFESCNGVAKEIHDVRLCFLQLIEDRVAPAVRWCEERRSCLEDPSIDRRAALRSRDWD